MQFATIHRSCFAFISVVITFMAINISPVSAQRADLYAVRQPVDATAKSAAQAQEKAIAEGRVKAANTIMQRMALKADWPKLPKITPQQAGQMLISIGVENERRSTVRYLATLVARFHAQGFRDLFKQAKIRYAETTSNPVMIFPVYEKDGKKILWDQPTPWRDAWTQLPAQSGLVPLLTPLGDLTDINDVGGSDKILDMPEKLSKIAQRYGAQDYIIASAQETFNQKLKRPVVNIRLDRFGQVPKAKIVNEPFASSSAEAGLESLLVSIALRSKELIEESWKNDNLVSIGEDKKLTLQFPMQGLGEWVEVRRRLEEIKLIRAYAVNSLRRSIAIVDLRYQGSIEQIKLALRQKGLKLTEMPQLQNGAPKMWQLEIVSVGFPAPAALPQTPKIDQQSSAPAIPQSGPQSGQAPGLTSGLATPAITQ